MGCHCRANTRIVSKSIELTVKVLILNHETVLGGGELTLLRFLRLCDRKKFNCELILPKEGLLADEARKINVLVHLLPFDDQLLNVRRKSKTFTPSRGFALLQSVKTLRNFIQSQRPDIVFSNSMKAHVYGSFALRKSGIPYGWRLHDIIDERNFSTLQRRFLYWLAQRYPKHISSVSNAVANPLRAIGIASDKISVVYNGVDILNQESDRIAFRSSLGLNNEHIVVMLAGRIMPEKGHTVLVEAARRIVAKIPHVRFLIVGTPFYSEFDYKAELESLIQTYSLGQYFLFAGFQQEMVNVYQSSEIVVQPSIIPESLPTVLLEAMANSRIVVSSDLGGSGEIVTDGQDGFLIPSGNPEKLAEKIILIASAFSSFHTMRENANRTIRAKFSSEQYVENMEQWIEHLSGK